MAVEGIKISQMSELSEIQGDEYCLIAKGGGNFKMNMKNIKTNITQTTGESTDDVMSQDAVTKALAEMDDRMSALEEQIKSLSPLSAVNVLLTDGSLVNKRDLPSSGYSKDEVVGFAIKTSKGNILVHPDISTEKYYFCNGVSKCDGYEVTEQNKNVSYASLDMDGKGNTDKLRTTLTVGTWACNIARNTVWKDGRQGHMMSLGEALIIDSNIDDLNECRTKCGCEAVPKINYWTSTLNAKNEDGTILSTWIGNCYGYRDGANVQGLHAVLPVAELDV